MEAASPDPGHATAPGLPIRRLGRTGLGSKALGLGGAWFGHAEGADQVAVDAVRRAIELGLDFIDTSPGYGQSERRIGLALAGGWRERVILQTKAGTHPDRAYDYSAEATRWSVHESLRRLRTDRLDTVLIHDPLDIEDPLEPGRALDELSRLKEEGVVGHIGLGVREHDKHRRAIETGRIDIVLTFADYTLLDQSVAATTLPLARSRDVGVILGSPLGSGRLTGAEPPHRTRAHAMWSWCRDRGVNLRHLALCFCLDAPIDGLVLFGPRNRAEVEDGVRAATTPVDPDLWRAFTAAFPVRPWGG